MAWLLSMLYLPQFYPILELFKTLQIIKCLKLMIFWKKDSSIRVDVVYDSYSDASKSIKNCELNLRSQGKSPLLVKINNQLTKVRKQWSRYIALPENKRNLIQFVSRYVLENITVPTGKTLYISGSFEEESECYVKDGSQLVVECLSLKSNQTEADTRIFLHAKHALVSNNNAVSLVIHSPDTDVFIFGIYFWPDLKNMGCKGTWLITGVSDRKRALGCHIASETLGFTTSRILPALHVFTGCDSTSKLGTKKFSFSVLKNNEASVDILELLHESNLTTEQLRKLEGLYLKIIKKKGDSCDESRCIHFLSNPSAVNDISCLPCTSDSFKQQVLRCFAQLYHWTNSMTAFVEPLDLNQFGFYLDENHNLRPKYMTLPALPDKL